MMRRVRRGHQVLGILTLAAGAAAWWVDDVCMKHRRCQHATSVPCCCFRAQLCVHVVLVFSVHWTIWCLDSKTPGWLCVTAMPFSQHQTHALIPYRNFAVPPSYMQPGDSRSATHSSSTRLSGIGTPPYRRRFHSAPRDFRVARGESSRFASSSEVTEQQGGDGVEGDGVIELEARPFPKVGDVVRYEGKWENDVSFGEVSHCTQKPEPSGLGVRNVETLVSLWVSITD